MGIHHPNQVEDDSMQELKQFIHAIGEGLRQLGAYLEQQVKGRRPALRPIPIRSRPTPPQY